MPNAARFECPRCKQLSLCTCSNCIQDRRPEDLLSIIDAPGDVQTCPHCGYANTMDVWADYEMEQFEINNPNWREEMKRDNPSP